MVKFLSKPDRQKLYIKVRRTPKKDGEEYDKLLKDIKTIAKSFRESKK